MYVEKDNTGRIIIQDISAEEASLLDDCICTYLADKPAKERTSIDKKMMKLKNELEKLY